ncbi:MAG: hypothetical protein LBL31_00915 [Spirochaetaceae bacterium]|jgi:hypothetical protein|nr:hypothetical protein [Spirochaetaceae bacterium]
MKVFHEVMKVFLGSRKFSYGRRKFSYGRRKFSVRAGGRLRRAKTPLTLIGFSFLFHLSVNLILVETSTMGRQSTLLRRLCAPSIMMAIQCLADFAGDAVYCAFVESATPPQEGALSAKDDAGLGERMIM